MFEHEAQWANAISNDLRVNAKKRKKLKEELKLYESVPQTTETYNGSNRRERYLQLAYSVLPMDKVFAQAQRAMP